jgi:hypothetical protein
MTAISLKLPAATLVEIDASAERLQISRSELVRQAVEEYLGRLRDKPAPSALDLAGDLVGSLTGPADLASNPDYLNDYGQ